MDMKQAEKQLKQAEKQLIEAHEVLAGLQAKRSEIANEAGALQARIERKPTWATLAEASADRNEACRPR